MESLVFCIAVLGFVLVVAVLVSNRPGQISGGVPGRGILLQVASSGAGLGNQYVLRLVSIDIEVPGQAPFVVTGSVTIPRNLVRDCLPGATVEVLVNPKTRKVAIVGPGSGFVAAGVVQAPPPR